jgi:anti-sigma regulatory factor (Ser/Thr protein kinase)
VASVEQAIYLENGQQIVISNCPYREVVSQFRERVIESLKQHGFQKSEIDDVVTVLKELFANLLHHDNTHEPAYLSLKLNFSDAPRRVELILEDREEGKIVMALEEAREAARRISEECVSEIPEKGRGYFIINALADVQLIINENQHHLISVKIPRDQNDWGFSFVLAFGIINKRARFNARLE